MVTWISGLLFSIGAALYAAAAVLYFRTATKRGPVPQAASGGSKRPSIPDLGDTSARAPALLALGALFHLGYITVASFIAHACPVGSVHFILSAVAITSAFFFTLARARAKRAGPRESIDALGLLVAPLGLAFLLGTFFLDKPSTGHELGAAFIAVHVLVNLIGVGLFVLAGASATLYLVQERRLKQKRLAKIGALPPLDTLDRAVHRFLLLGFPLLTVGIVSGTFWAYQLETGTFDEVMRIVLGYTTWLLIGAVLLLRTAAGWRGRRSAYGTLLGLLCALSVLVFYVFRSSPTPTGAQADAPGAVG
ncbi:MAG: cytochrome c biogenesis protein CcsA [Myxococcales bacterium]|nr:cytochrome c biogenesis protein CcsA [Myxococcales bacterium]